MKIWAPGRYQKLEFKTLKDTRSTPDILSYKNPLPGSIWSSIDSLSHSQSDMRIKLNCITLYSHQTNNDVGCPPFTDDDALHVGLKWNK